MTPPEARDTTIPMETTREFRVGQAVLEADGSLWFVENVVAPFRIVSTRTGATASWTVPPPELTHALVVAVPDTPEVRALLATTGEHYGDAVFPTPAKTQLAEAIRAALEAK